MSAGGDDHSHRNGSGNAGCGELEVEALQEVGAKVETPLAVGRAFWLPDPETTCALTVENSTVDFPPTPEET